MTATEKYLEKVFQNLQQEIRRDLSKASALVTEGLKLAGPDTFPEWHGRFLLIQAELMISLRREDERKRLVELALAISRKHAARELECEALIHAGCCYRDHHEIPESHQNFRQAMSIAVELGDRIKQTRIHNSLGVMYSIVLDIEPAVQHFQAALTFYLQSGDHSGAGRAHSNLATLYTEIDNHDKAILHLNDSLKEFEKIGDKLGASITLSKIGGHNMLECRYDEALVCLHRACELVARFDHPPALDITHARMAWTYAQMGAISESRHYLALVQKTLDNEAAGSPVTDVWLWTAEAYEHLGETQAARSVYLRALELSTSEARRQLTERIFEGLSRLNALEGDHQTALAFQQELSKFRQDHCNKLVQRAMRNARTRDNILYSELRGHASSEEQASSDLDEDSRHLLERLVLAQARSNKQIRSIHTELKNELPHMHGPARSVARDTLKLIGQVVVEQQNLPQLDKYISSENDALLNHLTTRAPNLTPTELRVCILISANMRSKEIADSMFVTLDTIKTHRKNIRAKLCLPAGTNLASFLIKLTAADV